MSVLPLPIDLMVVQVQTLNPLLRPCSPFRTFHEVLPDVLSDVHLDQNYMPECSQNRRVFWAGKEIFVFVNKRKKNDDRQGGGESE